MLGCPELDRTNTRWATRRLALFLTVPVVGQPLTAPVLAPPFGAGGALPPPMTGGGGVFLLPPYVGHGMIVYRQSTQA
jgi:hypothetical protein